VGIASLLLYNVVRYRFRSWRNVSLLLDLKFDSGKANSPLSEMSRHEEDRVIAS